MLSAFHTPTQYPNVDSQFFIGPTDGAIGSGTQLTGVWNKPRGKSMGAMEFIAPGGRGGNGAIGANSTAAGGGGGGAGGSLWLVFPLYAVPDVLYIHLQPFSGYYAFVSIAPYDTVAPAAADVFALVFAGRAGGDAVGATGGTAGAAAQLTVSSDMPLGAAWIIGNSAGSPGIAGASVGGPSAQVLTYVQRTGGNGGAGLGIAGVSGTQGGIIFGSGMYPTQVAGNGGGATTPPEWGEGFMFAGMSYGGAGGSATHGSATGAGLAQARGGDGALGSGGGGSGGALTGSTPARPGYGGPGCCLFTCW